MFTTRAPALCAAAIGLFLAGCNSHAGGIVPNTIPEDSSTLTTLSASTSTVRRHVLTADYLMGRYGTTSVSPAKAAPVLDWAQTSTGDANAIAAAGIKTQVYMDPNRWATYEALYKTATRSEFAHTCSGARITSVYKSLVRYVTSPGATALHSHYASYVSSQISGAHVDAIFEDDSGPLSGYTQYSSFSPTLPCGYSDSNWVTAEKGLENSVPRPVILNGLGGLNGHDPSRLTQVLTATNVLGGVYEHCFSDDSTTKISSWPWAAMENTQLIVLREGKQFWCMARNMYPASGQVDARTWVMASFLLTYDPSKSVLFEQFSTPTGLHVMPESKLVALNPVVAQPSTIDGLKTPGGTYAREFNACYIGGASVGPCAAIVNTDRYYALPNPFGTKYRHTMALSGNGILDGGVVSTGGATPPANVPPLKAYIVFR